MGKQRKPFILKARLKSFKYAFNGIFEFFSSQHNALIHLIAAIFVISLGIWLKITTIEWVFIILAIGIVFMAELFNSAIENLADSITLEFNETIKKTKDLSAAGVLVAAIFAALIGLIIFIPHMIVTLEQYF